MKNLKSFHKQLMREADDTRYTIKESGHSKDLAKEDSLSLISEFVREVKKQFTDKNDQLEILRDASKCLEFFLNEIENTKPSSIDILPSISTHFDDFDEPHESRISVDDF
jgi:hypothetical protein